MKTGYPQKFGGPLSTRISQVRLGASLSQESAVSFRNLVFDQRARWFVVGAVAGLVAFSFVATQALTSSAAAATCNRSAGDGGMLDYGVGTLYEDPHGPHFDDSKGTYTTQWSPIKNSTPCQRISSLQVRTLAGGFAEFGWVQGESNCDHNVYGKPVAFGWVKWETSSIPECHVFPSSIPPQGQYVPFEVLVAGYAAHDYMSGGSVWDDLVDFNQGFSATGTERNSAADDCYAEWKELKEYHPANSWTYWDHATIGSGISTDCHTYVTSTHSGKES
jgi:hypothetical protein